MMVIIGLGASGLESRRSVRQTLSWKSAAGHPTRMKGWIHRQMGEVSRSLLLVLMRTSIVQISAGNVREQKVISPNVS